ncbi:aminotransferase [Nocardioides flavus (ex Wang et al. 2016)]|uniref:histidinol-phosphate transaminase n=1 Tax=Nocardioides flavus (ex Wang et al. 2016) TaxID=2058780 RepID=A0ABQ3HDV7_9ACTN|nr:aminotransferase class I/II-fold pyridoxal phosphate-dependent enzyme [Nocardioides flavus (ex Wang et al. 2016)]GHE15485.1 aminotransferase [Nocardioides flavus (ex Wang et al. 2016)]
MAEHPQTLPAAGAHGGDGPAVARALGLDPTDFLDLSQNLNPFAADVAELVTRHLDALGHYPDDRPATRLLAQALAVDPERLLLTNGGSEAIALLAAEHGGQVLSEPEFALHPRGDVGPVWRSDPHSPTGHLAGPEEHADIWDEAFYALATGRWSAGRRGSVVGSLTKTFACPGLRLGYVLVEDPVDLDRVRRHQPHWSTSALSLAVLPDLLESADLPTWSAQISDARDRLVALLRAYGLEVTHAAAPWVLVDRPGLREALAPHGVLVRDCTSFGMAGVARVAVPHPDQLARLGRALGRALDPPAS